MFGGGENYDGAGAAPGMQFYRVLIVSEIVIISCQLSVATIYPN